jgi:hypothetical protein
MGVYSGHENFSESTEEIAPLTEEEKKQKLEDLRAKMAEKRAKQAIVDKEEQKKNEVYSSSPFHTSTATPLYIYIYFPRSLPCPKHNFLTSPPPENSDEVHKRSPRRQGGAGKE